MSQALGEFYWISSRLVTEIVDTEGARGNRGSITVEPKVEAFGVSVGAKIGRSSGQDTIYSRALKATAILRPRTGTLEAPNDYMRFRLAMRVGTIDVPVSRKHGDSQRFQRIAVIYTHQYVVGIGEVFLAFFGSPRNILSDMDSTPYTPGRVPSAAPGLMRIINETRAQDEKLLDATETQKAVDEAFIKSDQDRIHWANAILREISDPLPPQFFEVLVRVDSLLTDVDLQSTSDNDSRSNDRVELAAIGAVVWASYPPAGDITLATSAIESLELRGLLEQESLRVALQFWRGAELQDLPAEEQTLRGYRMSRASGREQDEPLDDRVRRQHLPEALVHRISEDATWQVFVDWFFATTNTVGLKTVPLYKRRSLLNPGRYGRIDTMIRHGSIGQPIPVSYQSAPTAARRFVSTDGRIFTVSQPEPWEKAGGRELRVYGRQESRLTIATAMWRIAIDWLLRGR